MDLPFPHLLHTTLESIHPRHSSYLNAYVIGDSNVYLQWTLGLQPTQDTSGYTSTRGNTKLDQSSKSYKRTHYPAFDMSDIDNARCGSTPFYSIGHH